MPGHRCQPAARGFQQSWPDAPVRAAASREVLGCFAQYVYDPCSGATVPAPALGRELHTSRPGSARGAPLLAQMCWGLEDVPCPTVNLQGSQISPCILAGGSRGHLPLWSPMWPGWCPVMPRCPDAAGGCHTAWWQAPVELGQRSPAAAVPLSRATVGARPGIEMRFISSMEKSIRRQPQGTWRHRGRRVARK